MHAHFHVIPKVGTQGLEFGWPALPTDITTLKKLHEEVLPHLCHKPAAPSAQ